MSSMLSAILLYCVALPTVAAFLIGAVAWRPWRSAAAAPDGRWAGGLAPAAAFVITQAGFVDWPALPPTESWQWLAWLLPLLGLLGAIAHFVAVPKPIVAAAMIAAAATAAGLLTPGYYEPLWLGRGALFAAVLVLWFGLQALAERRPGASLPLGLSAATVAASVVIVASSNAKLSQLAGALAAGLGAMLVLAWWRARLSLAGAGVAVVAVGLPGLLFCAHANDYGDVPRVAFALAALAPLAMFVGELGVIRCRPAWLAALLRTMAVLIPAGAALALAIPKLATGGGYP